MMKAKIISFLVLFPLCEIMAVICTFMMQALSDIRKQELEQSYIDVLIQYMAHPINGIEVCIVDRNPFIWILPVAVIVLLIFALTRKARITSQIDNSGIYGTANWESIDKLTRKNLRGKRKFCTYTKKYFLNKFLESINENDKRKRI